MENDPFKADYLMKHLLRMMVSDQHITPDELDLVCRIAKDVLDMSIDEFSGCYAEMIREFFNPRYRV